MKDRIEELMKENPSTQFSGQSATDKVESLFGNSSNMAIGMGLGRKFGKNPSFMDAGKKFGQSRFLRNQRGG